ncbi:MULTISPECIES: dihydrolipoyllysine-residue acetyltransferase [unclassified Polaromonas]|jgi:pyruvate dehydrogenase E2 component (dihydrolipoamide acetyltransferase)|uniref:dihydrolipoyllysine-residue acetyltransferase n=1 Tax=unclassified Polaromonas TaxID=2638319 RepID=UPI000BC86064|nr:MULTISPECIES: dihydrolipoyllysine-residue acetyltransferase [unclassified Polaromonas]OYY39099.1 MAG: dihydrolipoyllysine-residue acetyltransferase [Polaromonas sp. 35-63-35]OYZ21964.1 MAG: dihydrolipoyllysine-residue acetyltransferase [Polaromonas sp. 16-63-31]OYZ80401.1 MAG: dihydrolipoyllysine-residue acetyltransferase [Polaromonas sp. 24-63-21]OZA51465.1 MAG: dihydrolipoyllysine-residue acetyltransferase [Polaromonas sp. 17-63-33]OZA90064.1 MAG: dihydrolipoyllysine-residue acetyltransfe
MALVDIQVPDIGDFDEVTVIELLVKPGDTVKAEQSLITVESDKASMEIPSSQAGVVKEVRVKLGDKVKQGSVVLVLEGEGAAATAAPAATPVAEQNKAPAPAAPAPAAIDSGASTAAPAATAAGPVEVRVPDIGDFKDVAVIEVLVKVGDMVKAEQSLVTVESDKASMEIPSSVSGVIRELKVKLGDKINIGDLLAILEGVAAPAAAASAPAPAPAAAPAAAAAAPAASRASAPAPAAVAPVALPAHEPAAPTGNLPHASPSVRKFARELGVPLGEVKGSGPKGRITLDDVQGFTKAVMAGEARTQAQASKAPAPSGGGAGLDLLPWPKVDFTKFGPVERKDMSRIKKISGANLHRNWVMIPHVCNHDDADITELEAFRVLMNKENEKAGIKITMLAFLIKASVAALKKFPEFNASLDGDQLVLKQYYNVAFAADTPNGLVVPVIKDADKKGVVQISQEMGELAKKARDGKLSPADMQGACFTISSLGGIGGRYFTPIINAPEVAILGVCKSSTAPVWDGQAFQPRLMLPLSLSWDHRVIDGASAARFNAYLGQILGDFRRVLL